MEYVIKQQATTLRFCPNTGGYFKIAKSISIQWENDDDDDEEDEGEDEEPVRLAVSTLKMFQKVWNAILAC